MLASQRICNAGISLLCHIRVASLWIIALLILAFLSLRRYYLATRSSGAKSRVAKPPLAAATDP